MKLYLHKNTYLINYITLLAVKNYVLRFYTQLKNLQASKSVPLKYIQLNSITI